MALKHSMAHERARCARRCRYVPATLHWSRVHSGNVRSASPHTLSTRRRSAASGERVSEVAPQLEPLVSTLHQVLVPWRDRQDVHAAAARAYELVFPEGLGSVRRLRHLDRAGRYAQIAERTLA